MRIRWPRARTLLAALIAIFFAVYTGVFLRWNDEQIAASISGWVSGPLAGRGGEHGQAFSIGRVHYPYWSALRSLFLGGACRFEAWNVGIYDPEGHEVIFVPHATGRIGVGRTVWAQLVSAFPRQRGDVELPLTDVVLDQPRGQIAPTSAGPVNLVAAFTARVPHPSGDSGMVITASSVTMRDASFTMAFPGWRAEVPHLEAFVSSLRYSSFAEEQGRDKPAFTYRIDRIAAPKSTLTLGAFRFPIEELAVARFQAQEPERQNLEFAAGAESLHAPVAITGSLLDVYGAAPRIEATLKFHRGGGLLTILPTGDMLGGDPEGEIHFRGPFTHTLLAGQLAGLEFRVAGVTAHKVRARFLLDDGTLAFSQVAAELGGGRVGGAVTLDLRRLTWRAELKSDGVDPAKLGPVFPAEARRALGGRLDGSAEADGSFGLHADRVRVHVTDGRLSRRARDKLPRTIAAHGTLALAPGRIRFDGFRLAGDGVNATFDGELDPRRRTIESDVAVEGRNLGRLLARFDLPPLVNGLSAETTVSGSLLAPTIDGTLSATEVGVGDRRLPLVDAGFHFERGTLALRRIHSEGFGGDLAGSVELGLFDGPFTRRLADPTLKLDLQAHRVFIHTMLALPNVRGDVSGTLHLDGTLAHPVGQASLTLPELSVYGDPYRDGTLRAAVDDRGLDVQTISLQRNGGGRFTGHGRVGWDGSLDVDVVPRNFPLAAIPALRASPVALAGALSGTVHLGGALGKWIPAGVIEAASVKVREFLFGDGKLELTPAGSAIRLSGEFFNRFRVDGRLVLFPTVAGDVTIAFDDLPIDELIPEMKKLAEVQGVASGVAHLAFDLAAGLSSAELRLSKLVVAFSTDDDEGGDVQLAAASGAGGFHRRGDTFRNEGDVIIVGDGKSIRFEQVHLRSRIGELEVKGNLSAASSDLVVHGQLQLQLLEYFAAGLFQHTHGEAFADLRILGPAARPRLVGTLDLRDAELEPRGADRMFKVPEGTLRFDEKGFVELRHLRARLDGAEALASGRLEIKDWTLGAVALDLTGEVSATLLAWLFPDHVGETGGRFGVDLHVGGRFPSPTWDATVEVRDVFLREKKLSRDVHLVGGRVTVKNLDVFAGCVAASEVGPAAREGSTAKGDDRICSGQELTARIDESSDLSIRGFVALRGSVLAPQIARLSLHVHGENLEWGSAGVFSLTVSPTLRLTGTGEHLKLSGQLNLVTGRYYQNFDVKVIDIHPRRTDESEAPFYEGLPLLEEMDLDLLARSSGPLLIKNNLADLNVSVPSLVIGGTLGEPTFSGSIFVEQGGRFAIPYLRAEFISDPGEILFEEKRSFPRETPRLDLHASADWQDRYDQIHHIILNVRGTYREPDLDLSSTDGWDKARVLSALFMGGTTDDIRRAAQDPQGRGVSISDGAMKSVTGRLLDRFEDPLRQATRFDVVRLELGYDSVLIKLCPLNRPAFKLCGTGDVGFVSTTRYDARGELKLSDIFSVVGSVERVQHDVDTIQDDLTRGRFQLMLKRPLY